MKGVSSQWITKSINVAFHGEEARVEEMSARIYWARMTLALGPEVATGLVAYVP